jgi:adenylate kinase family enzyme
LRRAEPSRDIIYVQTGQGFRDFIKGDTFTQKKAREIYEAGGLQPEFLAVQMWEKPLIEKYKGGEHIIFDGTPRKFHEAGVLDSVFGFYGIETMWVLNIDISPEESMKRLLLRKRFDDDTEEIKKRLAWYETDVAPAVEYYRTNPRYHFLKIDGERSIEDIHQDIMSRLGLS